VPVTAKLSRKFYEQFGDEIVGELVDWFNSVDATYQTQLREMNELNWERFKATLEGETASLRAELRAEMQSLASELRAEMQSMASELRAEMHSMESKLRAEMHSMESKLRAEMHSMESRLREEMQTIASQLRVEMHAMRADLLKWMFIYWSGSIITLGGLMFALLRLR
jgi:Skp family chaperone for outer membrane proteins